MAEKGYQRRSWIILFVLGVLSMVSAVGFIVQGRPFDGDLQRLTGQTWAEISSATPGLDTIIRLEYTVLGLATLGFSLFITVVSVKSFRKREKWAWYTLWYFPLLYGTTVVLDFTFGGSFWPIAAGFAILFAIGLLLPVKKFFPGKKSKRT